jgi:hypothetical protein
MPPVRERSKSQKVRENESTAALLATPRGTPRAPSRAQAPRKKPSGRLDDQDLNEVSTLQPASRARGALPTPEDTTQSTQVVRDSVAPPAPILLVPRASIDFPSPEPPTSDIEMGNTQLKPYQSIEDTSDKKAEEEEELDYDIKWKVLVGKKPIMSDIISRSDFRFVTLC